MAEGGCRALGLSCLPLPSRQHSSQLHDTEALSFPPFLPPMMGGSHALEKASAGMEVTPVSVFLLYLSSGETPVPATCILCRTLSLCHPKEGCDVLITEQGATAFSFLFLLPSFFPPPFLLPFLSVFPLPFSLPAFSHSC